MKIKLAKILFAENVYRAVPTTDVAANKAESSGAAAAMLTGTGIPESTGLYNALITLLNNSSEGGNWVLNNIINDDDFRKVFLTNGDIQQIVEDHNMKNITVPEQFSLLTDNPKEIENKLNSLITKAISGQERNFKSLYYNIKNQIDTIKNKFEKIENSEIDTIHLDDFKDFFLPLIDSKLTLIENILQDHGLLR